VVIQSNWDGKFFIIFFVTKGKKVNIPLPWGGGLKGKAVTQHRVTQSI